MSTYREKALSYLTIVRLSDKLLAAQKASEQAETLIAGL
jgi:hypothetical protein